jgi:hypothetical protein
VIDADLVGFAVVLKLAMVRRSGDRNDAAAGHKQNESGRRSGRGETGSSLRHLLPPRLSKELEAYYKLWPRCVKVTAARFSVLQ